MKRAQQGFALIAAIILVVLLAALAAFVASMVSGQGANQNLERMSRTADLAAQAGLEWGAYQALKASSCLPVSLPANTLPGVLAPFKVDVTCTLTGGPSPYLIVATAKLNGAMAGSPDYVERKKSGYF